jgi:hypothetical protein
MQAGRAVAAVGAAAGALGVVVVEDMVGIP